MSDRKLRFGVMVDDFTLEAWQALAIERLLDSGHAELVLVIRKYSRAPEKPSLLARISRLRQRRVRQTLLWELYQRLFAKHSTSLRRVDCSRTFAHVDCLCCHTSLEGRYSEIFHPDDVSCIREHRLDFLVRFGFGIIRGAILDVAKYGVWSYHHGDERRLRGGPPCFWEIVFGHQTTGSILQRLTHDLDNGLVLHRGVFPTHWDYFRNLDQAQWKSAEWCSRVCREIVFNNTAVADHAATVGPIMRTPSNASFLKYSYRWLCGFISSRFQTFFQYDLWNVGIVRGRIHEVASQGQLADVQWLPSVGSYRYLADPFALRTGNGITILVEDFEYRRSCRGRIGQYGLLHTDVPPKVAGPITIVGTIEAEHHLSYPYLLALADQIYCIPESFEARRCDLYRLVDGRQAVFEATLLDGIAFVDPTIFQHDGRWWLFFTNADRGSEVELFAYYADELLGDWRPHLLNPIKCDVSSSRPAGTPFVSDGVFYRPAQDCSVTYGGAVVLNRVIELSPTRFREEVISRISPEAPGEFPDGFHTLNQVDDLCVVDGKRIVTDLTWFFRRKQYYRACAARRERLRTVTPTVTSPPRSPQVQAPGTSSASA